MACRLRRAQTVVLGRHDERDIVAHTEDLDSRVRNLREAVEILTDQLDEQRQRLDRTLTHHGIVRYDAFRDTGGEQSASFALLDTYRSGVVISAITARDFTRFYVKHVIKGVADRDLSPEEAEVMKAAVPRPLAAGEESPGPGGRRSLRTSRPPPGTERRSRRRLPTRTRRRQPSSRRPRRSGRRPRRRRPSRLWERRSTARRPRPPPPPTRLRTPPTSGGSRLPVRPGRRPATMTPRPCGAPVALHRRPQDAPPTEEPRRAV